MVRFFYAVDGPISRFLCVSDMFSPVSQRSRMICLLSYGSFYVEILDLLTVVLIPFNELKINLVVIMYVYPIFPSFSL